MFGWAQLAFFASRISQLRREFQCSHTQGGHEEVTVRGAFNPRTERCFGKCLSETGFVFTVFYQGTSSDCGQMECKSKIAAAWESAVMEQPPHQATEALIKGESLAEEQPVGL
ncbi:hypothetical protein UY3_11404 [Chelonia mydas]|uniref:Uncharacterized protein n=1 Tax=Chelonia mydas TaxID=8469 RepID=M7B7G3_CHEMY|nr:hypothetical protein UY3_11404 [Chelonia mydas]